MFVFPRSWGRGSWSLPVVWCLSGDTELGLGGKALPSPPRAEPAGSAASALERFLRSNGAHCGEGCSTGRGSAGILHPRGDAEGLSDRA